jgi:hypothetical protein
MLLTIMRVVEYVFNWLLAGSVKIETLLVDNYKTKFVLDK